MKKLSVVLAAVIILVFSAYIAAEDEGSGQEVVVKGQLKIRIDAEKPDIDIKTDINEVADKVILTEEAFLALSPEDIKSVKMSLPGTIYESRTDYHGEFDFFETLPVFSIKPKITNVQIEKWNFKVTDLAGRVVMQQKGNGGLPDEFVWDGFDSTGEVMKLGTGYSYRLSYMDKAGNPGIYSRKRPKVVTALKYKRPGKPYLYLEVSHKVLFNEKRKEKISDTGKDILSEVEDYIKMSNTYPVEVMVYSDDKDLASDQIRAMEMYLMKRLKLPKDKIKMTPYKDTSVPKNRRTVFVIING